jgi:hypothetical protein
VEWSVCSGAHVCVGWSGVRVLVCISRSGMECVKWSVCVHVCVGVECVKWSACLHECVQWSGVCSGVQWSTRVVCVCACVGWLECSGV